MNTELEKTNKFQRLINFIHKYGLIFISIIIGIIGILSIFITAYFNFPKKYADCELTSFKYSIGIIEVICVIFSIIAIALLCKKILKKVSSKILLLMLLIVDIFVFIFWINLLKMPPIADQKLVNNMAIGFLNNNLHPFLENGQYLFRHPYQFGITYVIAIIYKIFGENFIYVQYANAIFSIINLILIYLMAKIIFKSENIQKILVVLLAGFSLYFMFFNIFIYGNILGLTLALLASLFTLLYLDNGKKYNLILVGIFSCLSIIIKTNYYVFLCGIIIVLILDIIRKWNIKLISIIPIFLISFILINLGYNALLKYRYNINLPKGIPMTTFIYMGMSKPTTRTEGWYTGDNIKLYSKYHYNNEKTSKASIKLIKKRIKYFYRHPKKFKTFYTKKILSTWLNPTFQTIWISTPIFRDKVDKNYPKYFESHKKVVSMIYGNLYDVEEYIFNIYEIIIFVFASIGIFKISKEIDLKKSLFPIIFFGGFLFHIIWETKCDYVIPYYFILLPYGAYGINYIIEKSKNLFNIFIKKKVESN